MAEIYTYLEAFCLLLVDVALIIILCMLHDDDCQPINIQDENNNQANGVTTASETV